MTKLARPVFYAVTPRTRRSFTRWLDSATSWIVRHRDLVCVTCGTTVDLTCSHYIRRGVFTLRWHLVNCNCQCRSCNKKHDNNPEPYRAYMVMRYGEGWLEELSKLHATTRSWHLFELKNQYRHFLVIIEGMLRGTRLAHAAKRECAESHIA